MKNESRFKILILSEVILILKEKEQALLESSRQHPTNSQKEILEQVGISRLSVTDMTLEFNRNWFEFRNQFVRFLFHLTIIYQLFNST